MPKERPRHTCAPSASRDAPSYSSVRAAYEAQGADAWYAEQGASYRNPHETSLHEALHSALDEWAAAGSLGQIKRALDLACGSGEASVLFERWAASPAARTVCACGTVDIDAADPHTHAAYEARTGRRAHRWSFEDVGAGILDETDGTAYDLVLCSFALHLLEASYLHTTLSALARSARLLLIATPHKRPHVAASTGWEMLGEVVRARVRVRLYSSTERAT